MWVYFAGKILRNRLFLLILIGLITSFMAYKASNVSISYNYVNLLPEKDSTFHQNILFREIFKEDVNMMVLGIQDPDFFTLNKFNDWYTLGEKIKSIEGVEGLASPAHTFNIRKNKEEKKFEIIPLVTGKLNSQEELDSIKTVFLSMPFYKDLLYCDSSNVYIMGITINEDILNTRNRESIIYKIEQVSNEFGEKYGITVHHSGLPYTRTVIAEKVRHELFMFIILALIVTAVILYLFFRSAKVVLFSMLVVSIGVVWAFGSIVLFGYKITVISGMIPPLIIVIGIPNCIYIFNKYQQEFIHHGNKIKALQRVIRRIGNATFLTNLTTALGFATFITTNSEILIEFGIIASLNIMGVFFISIIMIPIIFSFLSPPGLKQTNHLDNKYINAILKRLIHIIVHYRTAVFVVTFVLLGMSFIGISLMKTTGYLVDDISHKHKVYIDLKFFEEHLKGVMPLEIMIDTKKPRGVLKLSNLNKLDELHDKLSKHPELSRSISISEAIKFTRQAYYNGKEKYYAMPGNNEVNFIMAYLLKDKDKSQLTQSFVDSTARYARISTKVADIGTTDMSTLYQEIGDDIFSVFSPADYDVVITGTSILFFKGTGYLIRSLYLSLILAVALISLFMASMFRSWRMILVSLIPNLIPLILTAAIMGFLGIPIKPSTVLVFSIAFGISVDNTIHFLAKYRQELIYSNWNIGKSVIIALKEIGVSMIYTSIVLFFGFAIFMSSTFGGTVALGFLISITLLEAVIANLVLLPALLLTLEKRITTKSFKEPLLNVFDEEEDVDLNDLEIEISDDK